MKKIILIALIFVCSKGFGQSGETLEVKNYSGGFIIHGSPITSSGILTISKAKQDTIRVIMLCADTLTRFKIPTSNGNKPVIFWQYGYEVADRTLKVSQWIIYKYLDADKKELSKNIIVWDSKKIKQ